CLRCTNPRRSVRSVLICFLSKAEGEAKLLLTPPVAMSNLIIRPSSNHLPPFPPRLASLPAPTTHLTHVRSVSSPSPPPLLPPSVRVLSSCSASCRKSRRDKGGGGGGGEGRGVRCVFKISKGGGVLY
ncbi:unnamed protein product, partial [Musa textilis]